MTDNHLSHLFFEHFGKQNRLRYWHARDLMHMLGYEDYSDFEQIIQQATAACAKLDIPLGKNFECVMRWIDGVQCSDYCLSKFACHLVTIHGDMHKEHVLRTATYLNVGLQAFMQYIHAAREAGQIAGSHQPHQADGQLIGLDHFVFFKNADHLNLYNMSHQVLRKNSDSSD